MDRKMEVLACLQQDARLNSEQIARMLDMKEADVAESVNKLEQEGIIVKYNTVINHNKIDNGMVQALIEVRVSPQRNMGFDAIAEKLYKIPEVKSVYLMSGAYDLMVIIEGKSLKDVALFVSERLSVIDNILSTSTHFILKQYKIDGIIMADTPVDDRLVVSP